MSDDFPDGLTFTGRAKDKETNSQLLKELKALHGAIGKLNSDLNKSTNRVSVSNDNLEKAFEQEFSRFTKKQESTEKDFFNKVEHILENFDKYARSNAELGKISQEHLKKMYEDEKKRFELFKELKDLNRIQADLISSVVEFENENAKLRKSQYTATRRSGKYTEEDKDFAYSKAKTADSLLGKSLIQTVVESNPLFRAIATQAKLLPNMEQFREQRDEIYANNKKKFWQSKGMYEYDVGNSEDVSTLLEAKGKTEDNNSIEFRKNEVNATLGELRQIPDSVAEVLSKIDISKSKRRRKPISLGETSTEYETFNPYDLTEKTYLSKEAKSISESVPSDPTVQDVARLMGAEGSGAILITNTLNDLFGNSNVKEFTDDYLREKEEEKKQNGGIGPLGNLSTLIPALIPILGGVLATAAVGALVYNLVKDTMKRSKERDDLVDSFSDEDKKKLNTLGITPQKSGMVETTRAQQAITQGRGAFVDLSGSNSQAVIGTGSDSDIKTFQKVLEDKNKYTGDVRSIIGDPLKTRGLYWMKDSDGKYYVSKDASMTQKFEWVFDDESQKGNLFNTMRGGSSRWSKNKNDVLWGVYNKYASRTSDSSQIFDMYLDDNRGSPLKFHEGGVVGRDNLIAQNGEVVLPVNETQYGFNSGMLQQTPSGGITLNKESKSDLILQKIYEFLASQMLPAVKESGSEKSSEYFTPPSLPTEITSYGAK